jgi:hypothetical protein
MIDIELQYDYCLQSVAKIIELKAKDILSENEKIDLESNKDYLEQMLAKDFWTDEDLTPLQLATEEA